MQEISSLQKIHIISISHKVEFTPRIDDCRVGIKFGLDFIMIGASNLNLLEIFGDLYNRDKWFSDLAMREKEKSQYLLSLSPASSNKKVIQEHAKSLESALSKLEFSKIQGEHLTLPDQGRCQFFNKDYLRQSIVFFGYEDILKALERGFEHSIFDRFNPEKRNIISSMIELYKNILVLNHTLENYDSSKIEILEKGIVQTANLIQIIHNENFIFNFNLGKAYFILSSKFQECSFQDHINEEAHLKNSSKYLDLAITYNFKDYSELAEYWANLTPHKFSENQENGLKAISFLMEGFLSGESFHQQNIIKLLNVWVEENEERKLALIASLLEYLEETTYQLANPQQIHDLSRFKAAVALKQGELNKAFEIYSKIPPGWKTAHDWLQIGELSLGKAPNTGIFANTNVQQTINNLSGAAPYLICAYIGRKTNPKICSHALHLINKLVEQYCSLVELSPEDQFRQATLQLCSQVTDPYTLFTPDYLEKFLLTQESTEEKNIRLKVYKEMKPLLKKVKDFDKKNLNEFFPKYHKSPNENVFNLSFWDLKEFVRKIKEDGTLSLPKLLDSVFNDPTLNDLTSFPLFTTIIQEMNLLDPKDDNAQKPSIR